MYNKLVHKETRLALVGLGYVGLPIALEFAKKISVIGFDINEERLTMMRQGIDPCKELDSGAFENADIEFTSSIDDLRKASFFIVAVTTPIDDHNQPDLTPLLGATRSVAKALKKGDYVVYESTVYPGCTEEDCIPVLEEISGLKAGVDFIPPNGSIRERRSIPCPIRLKLYRVVIPKPWTRLPKYMNWLSNRACIAHRM